MHVGITQKLLGEVRDKIWYQLKPKDYKLTFGVDNIDSTFVLPSDHPIVPKIIWGKHAHLQSQMPTDWCESLSFTYNDTADLHLRFKTRHPENKAARVDVMRITLELKGKRTITVPPRCNVHRTFDVDHDTLPEIADFFDKKEMEAILERKWQRVTTDVRQFLGSNKSLNAAIKAWPEVRAFIPTSYLERVDRKVERKASIEEVERKLAEIDREGAVAAATLATLAA